MDFPLELLINAIIAGVLLGGFYIAVTVGVSISFGMLDIVNIAHPAFIILGSYIAYIVNSRLGLDPVLVGLLMLPVFYALGAAVYQVYYVSFEKRGQEALRGLAFFFGILLIIQPVEPSVGRDYIGRVFAICVLGGLGSLPGTVIGAMLLGVVESITATFSGPSWAPAVAFGFLLLTLAFRPAGILGR